ncbi:MAG: hypothetical protein IJQ28_01705, partial [Clostridia bacterium]|nr:hypothetical protein [Clostridia bacterium]
AGGTEHPTSVWLSYAFIHFAYLMVILTPVLVRNSSSASVFGFALGSISATYFFVEFFVGIIFIFLKLESVKIPFIVQIIIFGFYAAMLLSHMLANENTADSIERHEVELKFVKECSAKLKFLMDNTQDAGLKKSIEKAYDTVHASQVKSNIAVRNIELYVMKLIETLISQVRSGATEQAKSTVSQIIHSVNERNTQLKLMN